jgi:inner membrane protein
LAGCAITLFYLLLLSLAEQIGFTAAYCVATLMTVGLVYGYTRRILTSRRNAALVSGGLSILYGYLFALLHEQEYALLAGSIGLFLMLGLVMYLTRNIDWYQTTEQVVEKRPKQNKEGIE